MFLVYVLQSELDGSYYVGMTSNLGQRLRYHNRGKVKSTRSKRPWRVVYQESFTTRLEARSREKYLKSAAGRRYRKSTLRLQ